MTTAAPPNATSHGLQRLPLPVLSPERSREHALSVASHLRTRLHHAQLLLAGFQAVHERGPPSEPINSSASSLTAVSTNFSTRYFTRVTARTISSMHASSRGSKLADTQNVMPITRSTRGPPWQLCSRRRGGDKSHTRVTATGAVHDQLRRRHRVHRRQEPFICAELVVHNLRDKSQTSRGAHGSTAYSVEHFSCTPPLAQGGCLIPPVAPICETRDDSHVFQKCTRTIAFVPKWSKDNNFARVLKTTLPPTIARKLVTLTPLRSVRYKEIVPKDFATSFALRNFCT